MFMKTVSIFKTIIIHIDIYFKNAISKNNSKHNYLKKYKMILKALPEKFYYRQQLILL